MTKSNQVVQTTPKPVDKPTTSPVRPGTRSTRSTANHDGAPLQLNEDRPQRENKRLPSNEPPIPQPPDKKSKLSSHLPGPGPSQPQFQEPTLVTAASTIGADCTLTASTAASHAAREPQPGHTHPATTPEPRATADSQPLSATLTDAPKSDLVNTPRSADSNNSRDSTPDTQERAANASSGLSATEKSSLSISDLHPDTAKPWVVFGRVLATSPPRDWKTYTASGQLLEAHIIDKVGDTIKLTVFNEGVDKFVSILAAGNVCRLSAGRIKRANPNFSADPYELTFDGDSEISVLPEHKIPPVDPAFTTTPLSNLLASPPQQRINLISIILEYSTERDLWSAKGKPLCKRDIVIVDDTMKKVICTLWGNRAKIDLSGLIGKPVLITNAEMGQYNGKTYVNVNASSCLLPNVICPRANALTAWFDSVADKKAFELLE